MVNKIIIKCDACGVPFERSKGEISRSVRLGRRQYCSRKCCGNHNWINLPQSQKGIYPASFKNCNRSCGKKDIYSPFRKHFGKSKYHAEERGLEFTITLDDLKNQWEKQNGVCPLTGWNLDNPKTTNDYYKKHIVTRHPGRCSLDRIDSSKGYIPENIRFVCLIGQFAKNNFTDEQLIEFCKAVVAYQANLQLAA